MFHFIHDIILSMNERNSKKIMQVNINGEEYKFYSVYYSIGNGRFNIDKSIEDIKWIINHELMENNEKKTYETNNEEI